MRVAMMFLAFGLAAEAGEPAKLRWDFEGHYRLPEAAAVAKKKGRRILVGLSGSPT